jgi:tetratricopeptide (TPR) repeat protein
MKNFQTINNIFGWIVFAIALTTYWLSMEPTASFWDCGEFIAASYKLQVPHPPGAPLFLMIGRMFSMLSFGDTQQVGYWINFSSVMAGAATSMFLFWSIVLFGKKMLKEKSVLADQVWMLMGAGLVGSLAYTFCDSAWFSNVEAEVYAMSSFFTAFVVWAMLKWDAIEDEAQANRWLIFIFYMIGLSIGVHLLNLVTLPALAIIFYFKKYKPFFWGVVGTLMSSLIIIFIINEMIIPGLPTWAGKWEIFFVNVMGFPFGTGAAMFVLLIFGGLIYAIILSQRKNKPILNTAILAFTFILVGYSCYALVLIRANFNPPLNENNPSDIMTFVRYLKREQYGTRPLLYGTYYNAQFEGVEQGEPVYAKGKDKYEIVDNKLTAKYSERDQTILPRIWSTDEKHQKMYRNILDLKENERPTFSDNIRFFFSHQVGWMYVRYFFFNFAGRESDSQDADWLRPAAWFENIPPILAENEGRNNFFMIPFFLGLIGMYFQAIRDSRNFFTVALLFILTGVALAVYLNSPPAEPRERDYIYTGSYYAFSFWIGFSVIAIATTAKRFLSNVKIASVAATAICFTAPVLMAKDGWNDHNRSKRFFSVDTAVNDLQSCAPDSILFTGGDNDTFLQWYVQDVEGVRTDVRVIVTSYFNTSWYINQTMRQVYSSKSFPYTLTAHNYREGGPNNPFLYYYDAHIKSMDLHQYLDLLKKEHPGLRMYPSANVIPTRDVVLKVDVEKVKKLGIVPKSLEQFIVPEMHLKLQGNVLEVKDLALLDILATSNWERPVYVTNTALMQFNVDLNPYVVREGNTFRILPVENPTPNDEFVNTEVAFNNMINKFQFRNVDDPDIYYTEDYRGAVQNHRNNFNALARTLIYEEKKERAKQVLYHALEKMPDESVRYDIASLETIRLFFEADEKDQAIEIADTLRDRAEDLLDYYLRTRVTGNKLNLQLAILGEIGRIYYAYGETDKAKMIEDSYMKFIGGMQVKKGDM